MTAPRLVRRLLLQVVPKRYHLPLRYHYRRWRGTLDQEAALLKEMVNPGGTALDVGANVGVYTYLLWRLCARVEAFDWRGLPLIQPLTLRNSLDDVHHNDGARELLLRNSLRGRRAHVPGADNREFVDHVVR